MKKYKFRLEPVLELRAKKLDEKRLELAEIQKLISDEQKLKDDLELRKKNANEELIKLYSDENSLKIHEIELYKGFLAKTQIEINQKEEKIKQITFFLKAKQTEVNEALKEKKILEKLKEKEKEKYINDFLKLEAKELDDIASSRYERLIS